MVSGLDAETNARRQYSRAELLKEVSADTKRLIMILLYGMFLVRKYVPTALARALLHSLPTATLCDIEVNTCHASGETCSPIEKYVVQRPDAGGS